jgi:uncharacterized membrane protein (DUF2068 family)
MPFGSTVEDCAALTSDVDAQTRCSALRAVAMFEAIKGMLVLSLGLALLGLLHKDIDTVLEMLLLHLHIDPEGHLAHELVQAASRITDRQLWGIAAFAAAYSGIRFTEAWGLWHRQVWAEWFALLSGTLYLPWETVALLKRPNVLHAVLLLVNLAIVLYMGYIRWQAHQRKKAAAPILS